ncbi:MAG: helix-turn-helix domain-containing protein [Christensenellales bacterium]|jgi:two-component system response regulator YesN
MPIKREWYLEKLEMLCAATGIAAALFDVEGAMLMKTDAGDGFCEIARSCAICESRCRTFHADAGREASDLGEAYIARCPMGAIAITAPILTGGKYNGSAAFMPARMWAWDAAAREELTQSLHGLDIDRIKMIEAGERLPEINASRSRALMALILDVVAPEADDLEMKRLLSEQQKRINELVSERKTAVGAERDQFRTYPMHIEREMLNRVRFGDRNGARALLNELLGHIFYRAPGNMKLMKARVLELVVMISRAAVETGAEMEALLGLNYDFVSELSQADDYEELCKWVVRMLEQFLDTVSQSQDAPGSAQLNDALSYIRMHHVRGLSLDEVAAHAHISPYYLSHLFREKLGVTFVEYVTSVRMELAKNYLLHTRLPISVVAEKAGYDDAGYFGKVFKRYTGQTPKGFRRAAP